MASGIDPTKPVDGIPASKADLRANLQAAKTEIEALQNRQVLGQLGNVTISSLVDQPSPPTSAKVAIQQTDGSFRSVALSNLPATGAVSSVHGQTGSVGIAGLADQPSPAGTARVPVEQADGSFRSVRLSNLPVVASGGGIDYINVKAAPYNAVGDGSTDDRAAIQAALDAGLNSRTVVFPPGRYRVSQALLFGSAGGGGFVSVRGADRELSLVVADPGNDTFRARPHAGGQAANRFAGHHHFADLGIHFNNDSLVADQQFAANFNRCGMLGEPIGPAGIAYEDRTANGSFKNPINPPQLAWCQHSLYQRLKLGPTNVFQSAVSDWCGIFFEGQTYGSAFADILVLNKCGYGYVEMLPGIGRVTGIASSVLTLNGGNGFVNGAEVIVLRRPGEGAPPAPLVNRTQKYFVVSATGTSVRLALTAGGAPITITGAFAGNLYLAQTGSTVGEYSPDENKFLNWSCYAGRGGLSLVQNKNSRLDSISAYGPQFYAVQLWDNPTHGADRGSCRECVCTNGYFEGPTNSAYANADDYVLMAGDDCSYERWPTEIASRNHPGRARVTLRGDRNWVIGMTLKFPNVGGALAPQLEISGKDNFIRVARAASSLINDGGTATSLTQLTWP